MSGGYLLEWMALHTARRAANVVGRSGVVYVEAVCHFMFEQVFSGAFEEAMRWRAWGLMDIAYCLVVHARLCSVRRILPHSKCA